jgi:CubicO group peptidase (beta-lactamase class C family)
MEFPIHGSVAPGFEPVRAVFEACFRDDVEVGAGFCALVDGVVVADLWGGYRDAGGTRPWTEDTLVNVYSTTKGLAAAAVATLVDEGALDYDAPVRDYWPELRAAADGLTVTELLSHQAGLCGLREPLRIEDLYDWSGMCRRLERAEPLWPPGSAPGYHAVTWGFLVGELVRRVAGISLGELLRRRLAEPLGADVHLGLADRNHGRVADLIGPNRARTAADGNPPDPAPATEVERRPGPWHALAMENPLIRPYGDACSAAWRRAELAASNGHATARGIATIYAALARGGDLNGVRVLGAAAVDALREEVVGRVPDLVLGSPMRRGRGVNLNTAGELGPGPAAFGHTGTGGSLGMADPERRLGVGFVMNQLRGGGRRPTDRLLEALYGCVSESP